MFKKISGNFPKKIKECSKRFGGIFEKIPENVFEKSGEMLKDFAGEHSRKFQWMFEKIVGNAEEDWMLYNPIIYTNIELKEILKAQKLKSKYHMWKHVILIMSFLC